MTGPHRARSMRAGLRLILLGAVVLVLAGTGSAFLVLQDVQNDTDALADRISPARITTAALTADYLNQETGVRGFLLSGEEEALEPYRRGREAAADRAEEIRSLVPELPAAEEGLRQVVTAGERWQQQFAEPVIRAVRADGPDTEIGEATGRQLFDAVRAELTSLDSALTDERLAARERTTEAFDRLSILLLLALLAGVAAAAAIWLGLRRFVLQPLDRLAAASREVAAGDFTRAVVVAGPLEVRRLCGDVESMRERLSEALAGARTAETRLRAQADELAEQTESLRRSNEDLEQFAYVASHDLQEPLRKVASFCQMLQRRYGGQLDDRADQYIEFAVDGAKRMQQLINDLLAFSRVGRTSEGTAEVSAERAAQAALAALDRAREETGAQVQIGPLPTLPADLGLLAQLFQNLIGNAIKFRAEGRAPVVAISAERDGPDWHFRCADNGIGIDPQYADRVFVIFQRLHSKDAYSGTGIGLSLCKKIVEHHGGTIWLDPDRGEGAGTTVHWTMPAEGPTDAGDPVRTDATGDDGRRLSEAMVTSETRAKAN